MILLHIVELRIPFLLALLITFGFGVFINIQVAHKLFNRTAEPRLSPVLLSYPLALLPALLAQVLAGTFAAMGIFGAAANGIAIYWYRMKLKKEVANNALQAIGAKARLQPER